MIKGADRRWPWHVRVTRADGTTFEDDYAADFDIAGWGAYMSKRDSIARIDVSVSFVDGEAVSPQATASA